MNRPFLQLLILLGLAISACAGEAEVLLRQIRTAFQARPLWELTFEQQQLPQRGTDTLKVRGRLLACPDGAFRVDMEGAHLISDGKNLWRWEEGGGQVLLELAGQSEDILLPHQLLILVEERFRPLSLKGAGKGRKLMRLQARSGSEFMRDVALTLRKEGSQWWPGDVAFTDFTDSRMRFVVLKRQSWADRNSRRQELTFRLPAGMELIDLRPGKAGGGRP